MVFPARRGRDRCDSERLRRQVETQREDLACAREQIDSRGARGARLRATLLLPGGHVPHLRNDGDRRCPGSSRLCAVGHRSGSGAQHDDLCVARQACVVKKAPFISVAVIASNPRGLMSLVGAVKFAAALLTRPVSGPCRFQMSATASSTNSALRTSTACTYARWPCWALISAAACCSTWIRRPHRCRI